MRPRTDFQTIIKELLTVKGISYASLALECECTETHMRGMALGRRGKILLRVTPTYDIGQTLVRKYVDTFNKPEPRLW